MIGVAETTYYSKRAAAIMSEDECDAVIEVIAREAADRARGSGQERGARLIYYHHNDAWPVLLLEVFAKSEKANLSKPQRNTLAKVIAVLKAARKG